MQRSRKEIPRVDSTTVEMLDQRESRHWNPRQADDRQAAAGQVHRPAAVEPDAGERAIQQIVVEQRKGSHRR